ncbi:MAG: hypothetical protein EA383_13805 [Spirochaetaceae bacterium]|nr:MAG: hypothetical protein EA383_13805 [Spirochaetaceae bacterium]
MRRYVRVVSTIVLLAVGFTLSGCATIVRGTQDSVTVGGVPDGSRLTVYGAENEILYNGPASEPVRLRRQLGLATYGRYRAQIEHPDFEPRNVLLETDDAFAGALLTTVPFLGWLISVGILAAQDQEADPFDPDDEVSASVELLVAAAGITAVVGFFVDVFTGSHFRLRPTEPTVEMVPRSGPSEGHDS